MNVMVHRVADAATSQFRWVVEGLRLFDLTGLVLQDLNCRAGDVKARSNVHCGSEG